MKNSPPLPPPIRIEPGNFAGYTFAHRLPRIVDEIASRSGWDEKVQARLARLRDSLPNHAIPTDLLPLDLDPDFFSGSDLEGNLGSWDELPFFEAETIFQFAILGATGYRGEESRDPFFEAKRAGLETSESGALATARVVEAGSMNRTEELSLSLEASLWGNVHDLSHHGRADRSKTLLVDDRELALELLVSEALAIDLILDNVGGELLSDLFLTDALLRHGKRVRLHHKPRPFFVSDATRLDCLETVSFLAQHSEAPLRAVGARLQAQLAVGRLSTETDLFWCRPFHLTHLPDALRRRLEEADLLILKGDLNYRRIIEDRPFPLDERASALLPRGLPPLLALRVLKSEVLVGLARGQAERLFRESPDWMTSGEFAVLQMFSGAE